MSTKKKLLQAAAGSAGGAGLDIPEVFSTYLYTGTGAAQTISNGIDLNGEGGLLVTKNRNDNNAMQWTTTEYNLGRSSESNSTTEYINVTAFTLPSAGGYTINTTNARWNGSGKTYVSYSWRQAPKFFDALTYTGNGSSQNISHNLGSVPGMIICKNLDGPEDWWVYHRSVGNTGYLELNQTSQTQTTSTAWNNTTPTSTQFTVGSGNPVNENNKPYMAFLFAHNDGDGGFGPNGDQDIIKCGSFSTDSSGNATVNLGFEPQWLMVKATDQSYNWEIYDQMRGFGVTGHNFLIPNLANAEGSNTTAGNTQPTSTGFSIGGNYWGANVDLIYMAIRRGPLAEPENATDVFAVDQGDSSTTDPQFVSNFVTDFALWRSKNNLGSWETSARLINKKYLRTNDTSGDFGPDNDIAWDFMTGHYGPVRNSDFYSWMWKRAPSFCDVVNYSGTGSARNISHNLGVAPEMMWIKRRDTTGSWAVFHKDLNTTSGEKLNLNSSSAVSTNTGFFNSTVPTSSVFTVGTSNNTNASSGTYIAFLFATLAGISKVGSFTGTAATQTIDCGFSSGARFVLIKETNTTGGWMVFDTVRGIVSGNDARLELDNTDAESTSFDILDPHSSGFQLPSSSFVNASGRECIFYAIA